MNDDIDYISILKKVPEFSLLDTEHLKKVASIVNLTEAPAGKVVFRENEMGDAFYIILSGEVKIFVTNEEGVEVSLLQLYPMDSFGGIGFITGKPRAASSKTVKESKLIVITKNDFDEIMDGDPSLSRSFINILGHRLKTDNQRAIEQSSKEHELKQFWVEKGSREPIALVGKSKHIQELKDFSLKASENNLPVLLIGEKGTGKIARAQYIFQNSKRRHERYLTVDCASILQIKTTSSHESDKTNEILLGLSQVSTLFGHLKGSLPFAKTRRLGYIEVAEAGTIVIDNVEKLTLEAQNKLLSYLKTGIYKRIGSDEEIKSDVKLIFTCETNIDQLVNEGKFDRELFKLLSRQSILLVPLRDRQRDIHDLVDHFIEKFCKVEGKSGLKITKEAMNLLLAYEWPNNIDQLKGVIRRAVSVAEGEELNPSHVFIGPIAVEKRFGFNLLKFEPFRKFMEGGIFPNFFRKIIAGFFVVVILLLLFGYNGVDKTTVWLVWAFSWPLMLLGAVFASRLFCGLCPMRSIAEKIQEKIHLNLRLPDFIKKKGPYIAVFGFALIISIEHIIDMPNRPIITAVLFLSIFGFAAVFSMLFDRAVWCRYLCPLGRMNGVYSKLSIFEIRANAGVCNSECREPACYKGAEGKKGCPMQLGVFNMYTNENCIVCGQCIKNCKHKSIRLNIRPPAAELFRSSGFETYRKGANLAIAFFVIVLMAGALSMNFAKLSLYHQVTFGIKSEIVHYMLFYVFFYILCLGLMWFAVNFIKSRPEDPFSERFVWFACSFVPLAFAGEIANQIITFINGFGNIVPIVNLQLGGYDIDILHHQTSTAVVKCAQIAAVVTGAIASGFFGRRVVEKVAHKNSASDCAPVYVANAVFCMFYITVFMLRS